MKKVLTFFKILALFIIIAQSSVYAITNKPTKLRPVTTLSIEEAVTMGWRYRPSLRALVAATDAQKQQKKKSLSDYFPQLSLSATTDVRKYSQGINTTLNAHAEQLIFSFAGPLDLYDIFKHNERAAKLAEKAHKDIIRNQVERAFLNGWLLQQKKKQALMQATSARTTFEREQQKNELKLLGKNEWLTQTATFVSDTTTASLYKEDLRIAQSDLEQQLGTTLDAKLDAGVTFQFNHKMLNKNEKPLILAWSAKKCISLKPLSFYNKKALYHRKEIQIKQQEIEQTEKYKRYYHKQYLPNLNLVGDVTRTEYGTGSSTISQSIGTVLSWNFSDGGANYYEAQTYKSKNLRAKMEKESIIQQVKAEVETAYHGLKQIIKQLNAQATSLKQAENEFELRKQELAIGTIARPDLDQARFTWEDAQFAWLSVRTDVELKNSDLLFACGYPGV
jgi:outer membrane protein TolC